MMPGELLFGIPLKHVTQIGVGEERIAGIGTGKRFCKFPAMQEALLIG